MSGRPIQESQQTGTIKTYVSFSMIDDFGIAKCNSSEEINIGGKSVPNSSGFSWFNGKIKPFLSQDGKTFKYGYAQVAYSPPNIQGKLILPGWSSATVLVANNLANMILHKYADITSSPEQAAVIAASIWCIHFSGLNNFYIPRILVTVAKAQDGKVISSKQTLVGGIETDLKTQLDQLGQLTVQNGSTAPVASAAKQTNFIGATGIAYAISNIDSYFIGTKRVVYRYSAVEIVKNWQFWSQDSDEMGKPIDSFPLPPAAVALLVKHGKTNVNFRDKPSTGAKVIAKFNGGKVLLENSAESGGFWPAYDPESGNFGYISQDYIDMVNVDADTTIYQKSTTSLDISSKESGSESTKDSGQLPDSTAKDISLTDSEQDDEESKSSNTLIYAGIGIFSAICLAAVAFAFRKKK